MTISSLVSSVRRLFSRLRDSSPDSEPTEKTHGIEKTSTPEAIKEDAIFNELTNKYSARVKDIYLELPGYSFFHSPTPLLRREADVEEYLNNQKSSKFTSFKLFGREKVRKSLRSVLTRVESRSGTYLVTGFRGMGKTSLVRTVVNEINIESYDDDKVMRFIPIEISLAQDEIKDLDVLKLIARRLQEELFSIPNYFDENQLKENEKSKTPESKSDFFQRIRIAIEFLNLRINSLVAIESGDQRTLNASAGYDKTFLNTSYSQAFKKNMAFTPPSSKEIENELINILYELDLLRRDKGKFGKGEVPEILFIFDELDKIEPNYSPALSEKEAENPSYESIRNSFLADRTRRRQDIVGRILANLKNFLNVARAKFIFIGGREMYDASLADIADRDTFYGSIFNQIFYIESFLKDGTDNAKGNLSGLIEAVLCRALVGTRVSDDSVLNGLNGIYSLKNYINSIRQYIPGEGLQKEVILQKIGLLLQNLIVYLTYRSSGTPRKVTNLIESFIIELTPEEIEAKEGKDFILYSGNEGNNKLFVRLGYKSQFDILITGMIYRPYLIHTSRYLKLTNDSVLFSTSFIIDHLLKFHSFGFSWNNLEVIPEIITVNKAPYLRQYIEEILSFYMGHAIRRTQAGLYQFKFLGKYASELKFISKISDLANAAYNFTLDESLLIKRYYKRKLKEMEVSYQNYKNDLDKSSHIYSLGFLNTLLGDLHFYDKEFDDSVIHYTSAVQRLRAMNVRELTEQQAVNLLVVEQKLALTYEKAQMYDMAFAIYKRLIRELPSFFSFHTDSNEIPLTEDKFSFRALNLYIQPHLALMHLLEKSRSSGISSTNIEHSIESFFKLMTGNDELLPNVSGKSALLPFLVSSYFLNLGTILYFKNYEFQGSQTWWKHIIPFKNFEASRFLRASSSTACSVYLTSVFYFLQKNQKNIATSTVSSVTLNDIIRSLDAFLNSPNPERFTGSDFDFLGNVLSKLGDALITMTEVNEEFSLDQITGWLNMFKDDTFTLSSYSFQLNQKVNCANLAFIFNFLAYRAFEFSGKQHSAAFMLKKVLWFVYELFAQRSKKVNTILVNQKDKINLLLENLNEAIVTKIIEKITKSNLSSGRLQLLKAKNTLGYERGVYMPEVTDELVVSQNKQSKNNLYSSLTTSGEIREVIMLFSLVRLRSFSIGSKNTNGSQSSAFSIGLLKEYDDSVNRLISPFSVPSVRFTRLLELQFRVEFNHLIFEEIGFAKMFDDFSEKYEQINVDGKKWVAELKFNTSSINWSNLQNLFTQFKFDGPESFGLHSSAYQTMEYLVSDSIFCLSEMIRNMNLFGAGYQTTHSLLGYTNLKMAKWCSYYRAILRNINDNDENKSIYKKVSSLISDSFMFHLETNYYNEIALGYFRKAIEMHTGGAAYAQNSKNLYYSEDDLSDNFIHFLSSLERFRINTDSLEEEIKKLKQKLSKSKVYKTETYGFMGDETNSQEYNPVE